jgi:hypothetical protein
MATSIGYFGFVFAGLTFVAMIVSWFADNSKLEKEYSYVPQAQHRVHHHSPAVAAFVALLSLFSSPFRVM